MLYAVLGTGQVGRSLIADIWQEEPDAEILAIDASPEALESVQALAAGRRLRTLAGDARNVGELAEWLRGAAIVVNCTDGSRSLEILDGAITARVHYVDLFGTLLVNERLARDEAALRAGVTALIGMGCSPGVTNMVGAHLARDREGDVSIDIEYVTHRALNPSPGLLETALRQFRNPVRAPVWLDGRMHMMAPFEGAKEVLFPGMTRTTTLVYTPHSEPITLSRVYPWLKRVTVRGAYSPEMMSLLRALHGFGLMDPELRVTVGGERVPFQPLLREALYGDGEPRPSAVDPLYLLRVRMTAVHRGGSIREEVTLGHPRGWHPLPQAHLTALPTAFVARMIAHGALATRGVMGPETMPSDSVEQCLAYLVKRGAWIRRARSETLGADVSGLMEEP